MDTVAGCSGQKNRFLKLSLKKNKKNVVCEDRVVNSYQDTSFEVLTRHVFKTAQKMSRSPNTTIITLPDSDSESSSKTSKSPLPSDFENDQNDDIFDRLHDSDTDVQGFEKLNLNTNGKSSKELRQVLDSKKRTEDLYYKTYTNDKGHSPSPNEKKKSVNLSSTPNTENKVKRESIEHCTVEKIRLSQQKVLDELYGEQWRSIPTLFKTAPRNHFDNIEARKLSFSDEDKENTEAKEMKTEKRIEIKKPDKIKSTIPNITKTTEEKTEINKKVVEKEVLKKPSKITDVKKPSKITDVKKPSKITDVKKPSKITDVKAKVCVGKVKSAIAKSVENIEVKKLGFVASLADNVPTWRCDLEALDYKKNFKSKKEQLARKLYSIFNTMIFNRQLNENMLIEWDVKLRRTAGMATNRFHRTDLTRSSSIRLSTKVIDSAQRLRDTLVHEMCHAATWLVDHELRAGHGPLWKRWAARSLSILPELGEITRCHNMQIHFKFTYKCTKCGYSINRHSKSIDTERKRCGYCYGTLELIVNKKTREGLVVSTPAKPVEVNAFALFVKENYGSVKKDKTKTHAQVMKTLGEQYAARKALRKNE